MSRATTRSMRSRDVTPAVPSPTRNRVGRPRKDSVDSTGRQNATSRRAALASTQPAKRTAPKEVAQPVSSTLPAINESGEGSSSSSHNRQSLQMLRTNPPSSPAVPTVDTLRDDARLLVLTLPNLNHAAKEFLHVFHHKARTEDIILGLKKPDNIHRRVLDTRTASLEPVAKTFGLLLNRGKNATGLKHFINAENVMMALLNDASAAHEDTPWNPVEVLLRANLCKFAQHVFALDDETPETTVNLLEVLDASFAQYYTTAQLLEDSTLQNKAYHVAVMIRSLLARFLIQQYPQNPEYTLIKVFSTRDARTAKLDALLREEPSAVFSSWNLPGLVAPDSDESPFPQELANLTEHYVGIFAGALPAHEDATMDLQKLSKEFPLFDLKHYARDFIVHCDKLLADAISDKGGAAAISQSLEEQRERRKKGSKSRGSKSMSGADFTRLMRLRDEVETNVASSTNGLDTIVVVPPPPSGQDHGHKKTSRKSHLYHDQVDRVIVPSVDEDEQNNLAVEQVTQDEGFVSALPNPEKMAKAREAAAKKRKASEAVAEANTDTKRARHIEAQVEEATEAARSPARKSKLKTVSKPARKPLMETSGDDDDDAQEEVYEDAQTTQAPPSSFAEVKLLSSRVMQQHNETNQKPIQIRRGWSDEETDALIAYIAKFGPYWSNIKSKDQGNKDDGPGPRLLDGRDQGALKDRGRNMKFTYLKAGVDLPQNFEAIQLPKSMTDKLEQMGIDYEQEQKRQRKTKETT